MDPTCGADPAELVRHPIVLLEPDGDRADHLLSLFAAWRASRPVRWVRSISGARTALSRRDVSGCIVPGRVRGASARSLVRRARERSASLPVFVTPPTTDPAVSRWCFSLGTAYLPGTLELPDATAILDEVEGFESGLVSNLAYVVRLAQPQRLEPHEARLLVAYLDGVPEHDLQRWLRLRRSSYYSVKSRALAKVRMDRLEDLGCARRLAMRLGTGPREVGA